MESITIYCYEIRPPVLVQVKATINGKPTIPPHCNVRRHPWSCSFSGGSRQEEMRKPRLFFIIVGTYYL